MQSSLVIGLATGFPSLFSTSRYLLPQLDLNVELLKMSEAAKRTRAGQFQVPSVVYCLPDLHIALHRQSHPCQDYLPNLSLMGIYCDLLPPP